MKATRIAEIKALAEHHNGKGSKCVAMLLECLQEIERLQKPKQRSLLRAAANVPTLEQVKIEAKRRGWKEGQAEEFYAHYNAIGWVYGRHRHPVKSFTALMTTWETRQKKFDKPNTAKATEPRRWKEFLASKVEGNHQPVYKFAPEWLRIEFARWQNA